MTPTAYIEEGLFFLLFTWPPLYGGGGRAKCGVGGTMSNYGWRLSRATMR
jgi:hypothetical protein